MQKAEMGLRKLRNISGLRHAHGSAPPVPRQCHGLEAKKVQAPAKNSHSSQPAVVLGVRSSDGERRAAGPPRNRLRKLRNGSELRDAHGSI